MRSEYQANEELSLAVEPKSKDPNAYETYKRVREEQRKEVYNKKNKSFWKRLFNLS